MQAKLVDAVSKAFFRKAFTPHAHFFKIQTFVTGKISSGDLYFSQHPLLPTFVLSSISIE